VDASIRRSRNDLAAPNGGFTERGKERERKADPIEIRSANEAGAAYEQLAETILTLSTFSFGEAALLAAAPPAALAGVPVISTLCPTCGLSFASSASRRYSLAVAEASDAPAVPVAPDALALAVAFLRTNFVSSAAELDAPVVPVVPVADLSAF